MQFANYGSSLKPPDLEDPPEGVFSAFFVKSPISKKRQQLQSFRTSRYKHTHTCCSNPKRHPTIHSHAPNLPILVFFRVAARSSESSRPARRSASRSSTDLAAPSSCRFRATSDSCRGGTGRGRGARAASGVVTRDQVWVFCASWGVWFGRASDQELWNLHTHRPKKPYA